MRTIKDTASGELATLLMEQARIEHASMEDH